MNTLYTKYYCEQRSPEWFDLRNGCLTASSVSKIITPTGKSATGVQVVDVIDSLIKGMDNQKVKQGYVSQAMQHGTDTEDEARSFIEFDLGIEVEQVGFVKSNITELNGTPVNMGCSPDGIINGDDNYLLEIKCPTGSTHLSYLDNDVFPSTYKPQVQMQMYIMQAEKCLFVSYDPDAPTYSKCFYKEVERDEEYISFLVNAIENTFKKTHELIRKLKSKNKFQLNKGE